MTFLSTTSSAKNDVTSTMSSYGSLLDGGLTTMTVEDPFLTDDEDDDDDDAARAPLSR